MAKLFILVACIVCFSFSIVKGQVFGVRSTPIPSEHPTFDDAPEKTTTATTDYIGLYQKYISGIRGKACPMYPGCSTYGLKTFTQTNFASALALTADRLLRCGHDHKNYQLTLKKEGFKLLDYPPYETPPKALYYTRNSYFFAYSDTLQDTDSAFYFIKNLINNAYYQEALLEIMRIEFKKSSFDIELFINKIICLKALGQYEKALFDFETKCNSEYKQNPELLYQISIIEYKLGNYKRSLYCDSLALASCERCFLKPKLVTLQGLIYARQHNWAASLNTFETLGIMEGHEKLAQINTAILQKTKHLKHKSAALAGLVSVVPGLGYAYSGHGQTAITAFLVNGLLAYATYSNIKNKNYGMGILTGIFNLTFYIGNIQGAAKSAKRFNEQQKRNVIKKLEFNTIF